jgi:hypothetical protein
LRTAQAKSTVEHLRRQLDHVVTRIQPAVSHCREWSARGYPSTSGPIGGGRGDGTHTVERIVIGGIPDTYRNDLLEALRHLENARKSIEWLVRFVNRNTETLGLAPVLIDCANPHCEKTMSGLPNDRPRDGRCERCYRWRKRNDADWPTAKAVVVNYRAQA